MTNTQLVVGKSAEKPKLPKLSYLPPEQKRCIVEIAWWTRQEHWPIPNIIPDHPPFSTEPVMRESRYCATTEEAHNFIEFCKRVSVLNRPGIIVRMTWEVYALAQTDTGTYEHLPSPTS